MRRVPSPSMIRSQEAATDSAPKHEYPTASSSGYRGFSRYANTFSYENQCPDNLVYVVPSDVNEVNNKGEPVTKNAGSRWREDETEALVEIWRDKICQTRWWKQSKGVRVNKEMWEEIAQLLAERDVFRTASQCQIRMKNLLQFYRQTIDNRRSEKSMNDLPEYFDIVDSIMTRRGGVLTASDENASAEDSNEPHSTNIDENNNDKERKRSFTDEFSMADKSNGKISEHREEILQSEQSENRKYHPPMPNATNTYYPYPVVGSTGMKDLPPPDNYTHHSRWANAHSSCCDGQPLSKKPYTNNETDHHARPQDVPANRKPVTLPTNFHRAMPYYHDRRFHGVSNATDSCSMQSCYTKRNEHSAFNSWNKANHPEADIHVCNNTPSLHFIQELLNLQYKQMENFLEIEKKRLEVEEKRLNEERDAGQRHSAFLMEAVKILAETFRKNDNSNATRKDEET